MSIASQGTVLAQARTRSFDVYVHENYVAPRKDLGLFLILLADRRLSFLKQPLHV